MALLDRRTNTRALVTVLGIPLILVAVFAVVSVARAATANVTIQNIAYNPASITVNAGDTVTWTNNDAVDHTVSSDTSGIFNMASAPGSKVSFTFTTPGTFAYHCNIHSTMHGTVVVQAAASGGGATSTASATSAASTASGGATPTNAAPSTGSAPPPSGGAGYGPVFIVLGVAFVAMSLSAGLVCGQALSRRREQ